MEIKDRLVSWFVKNVAMPQMEIIDKPGFIATQFSEKKQQVFLREVLFPERVLSEVENKVKDKLGERGLREVYAAGKEFGYRYSALSFFPRLKSDNEKQVKDFVYMFMRYTESLWSKNISEKIDASSKAFEMDTNSFVVCNKNGLGYLVPSGVGAGFWSYIVEDDSVEGSHVKCEGRGDAGCKTIYAPASFLEYRSLPYFEFKITNPSDLSTISPSYFEMNKIRDAIFSGNSLKDMIDSKRISYKEGLMYFNNERHFICESSIFYFLENRVGRLPGGDKIIFDVSFDFGNDILVEKQGEKLEKFIADYLSPCGWGDIKVLEKDGKFTVVSNYFPWTRMADKIKFSMFRGIVSGIISKNVGRKVLLNKVTPTTYSGFLSLEISE